MRGEFNDFYHSAPNNTSSSGAFILIGMIIMLVIVGILVYWFKIDLEEHRKIDSETILLIEREWTQSANCYEYIKDLPTLSESGGYYPPEYRELLDLCTLDFSNASWKLAIKNSNPRDRLEIIKTLHENLKRKKVEAKEIFKPL